MTWLLLAVAIAAEVSATISMKLSDGFSKLVPSIVMVLGYVIAFGALTMALARGMKVNVAYGVWAAAGVALVALIGALFLSEPLTKIQIGGVILVIAGVLALEMGAAH